MRGKDEQQLDVFSYISPEQRVPQDHPLRSLRAMMETKESLTWVGALATLYLCGGSLNAWQPITQGWQTPNYPRIMEQAIIPTLACLVVGIWMTRRSAGPKRAAMQLLINRYYSAPGLNGKSKIATTSALINSAKREGLHQCKAAERWMKRMLSALSTSAPAERVRRRAKLCPAGALAIGEYFNSMFVQFPDRNSRNTARGQVMRRVPSQRTGTPQPHGGPARSQRLSPAPHEYEHPLRPLLAPTS
jgi:hypothetical protein